MLAIVQEHYGPDPDTVLDLAEIARPTIGDGEVLVRVAAASVDMGTWHCMTGMPYAMRLAGFGVRSPKALNPGRSLAGTVESVGTDVTEFEPGDEVYGSCDGSFAEYARVETSKLALKPSNLSFEQAAAAPISAGTALQAVRKAKVQPGQKVLIVGASGGVGTFAVQIAKAFGAEVTGVCSTAKTDLVRGLGADHVVDYARRGLRRRRTSLRRDPRHGREPPAVASSSSAHPSGDARDRRRRDRWTLARRLRPFPAGGAAVAAREPDARHARLDGERRGPAGPSGPLRVRTGHTGHRPHLPAERDGGGDPSRERWPRPAARSS